VGAFEDLFDPAAESLKEGVIWTLCDQNCQPRTQDLGIAGWSEHPTDPAQVGAELVDRPGGEQGSVGRQACAKSARFDPQLVHGARFFGAHAGFLPGERGHMHPEVCKDDLRDGRCWIGAGGHGDSGGC